ncbi:PREDICTED: uncharacterized protein LOC109586708 isoform X2 [Amphimedon queenslandica]|uniref:Death domain-containing protein n=1 Tax=Amphimedon queenslandica TaxID=400682 RepID=A0A1X7TPD7_AMPQE|nr:PREDICTED: uncharacterized protein LOC109586708 isoform X2 [Amphimedon queenslandica]|eukprot:XP_019858472.1 PREDICTED: uncharacterized protein LOC109586708 isoform X2 [Amphimedon queenslandica]
MIRKYTAKIPVSIRDIELLDQLNEKIKFRDLPRFRIQFTHVGTTIRHKHAKEVTVRFNKGSSRSPGNLNTVLLRSSPLKLDTGLTKNDSVLTEFIRIIEAEQRLNTLWHALGSRLNLSVDELSEIEAMSNNPDQCTARLIDRWKRKNKRDDSWDTLAAALDDIGFNELARRVGNLIKTQKLNPAAAYFQSNFDDIESSIAARLDQALPKFFGAGLISQSLHNNVLSMDKPNSHKSALVTTELLRGIKDSRDPSKRLERICKIFLKLEDEKLKEIVEGIASGNIFAKTARHPVSHPKEYSKRNTEEDIEEIEL